MSIARRLPVFAAPVLGAVVLIGVAAAQVRRNPPPRAPLPLSPTAAQAQSPIAVASVQRVALSCASDDVAETQFCDGAGICATARAPCFPYACDPAAHTCAASCTACAAGAECEDGRCVPARQVPRCDGNASVAPQAGGARRDCRPMRCDTATGLCLGRCASDADCVSGAACVLDSCVQRDAP